MGVFTQAAEHVSDCTWTPTKERVYMFFAFSSMTFKGSIMACSSSLKEVDELGPRYELWRATLSLMALSRRSRGRFTSLRTTTSCGEPCSLSLSSGYVKFAKEIEESGASAVNDSDLPSNLKTSSRDCAGSEDTEGCDVLACARGRDHVRGGRIDVACVIVLPEPFPLRDSQRNVRADADVLAC